MWSMRTRNWKPSQTCKKIVENPIVKNLEKMALKELPGVYEKDVKRSKMKKLKDCLGLTLQILQ